MELPAFDYRCGGCDSRFSRTLSISRRDEEQICPSCGTLASKVVSEIGFVLKGDGWFGKNLTLRKQMEDKNKILEKKQKERYGNSVSLAPNVDGERVDSWSEAKKLAASKGKDSSSYDRLVAKEGKK